MALTVVKVGGSLAAEPAKLRSLISKLVDLSKCIRLLVVPGGGEFADTVRQLDKRFVLDTRVSHRMAILAMDQYGLLLSDLSTNTHILRSFDEASAAFESGKLPIFLPSQVFFSEDPLENSWDVTSDSIALYVAYRLQAIRVLFVTDVDGIYTGNPKTEKSASLVDTISPDELSTMPKRTSVDAALPLLLKRWPLDCYVVNGFYPERIEAVLEGRSAVATLISSKLP